MPAFWLFSPVSLRFRKSECSVAASLMSGYLVRRLIAESEFENRKFYQADFPRLPGPVARAELHTFGDSGVPHRRLA